MKAGTSLVAGHVRRRGKRADGSTVWQAAYPDPARPGTAKLYGTFRTKREADDWLATQNAAVLRGDHLDPRLASRPFREVAAEWELTSWEHLGEVTRDGYRGVLRVHLLPRWGGQPVGAITHVAVQRYVAELGRTGLSPGTVRKIYAVFRTALTTGIRLGLIRVNPCAGIKLPRAPREEMLFCEAAEVEALAAAITPPYGALILAAAYTGCRVGELTALTRADFDPLRGVLQVRRALKDVNGHVSFGPTKTHARRAVALPAFLTAALCEHLAVPGPNGSGPEALIFPSTEGGPLRHSNFYRRHYKPAVRAALPPAKHGLRFHDLRHTCAALLIAAGAHPKAIQDRLGHSSIQMTLDRYGHLMPNAHAALAALLDATRAEAATTDSASNVTMLAGSDVSTSAGRSGR